jgi:hypothetical protein
VDADRSTGAAVGAPAPVREFDIPVEHPGVEHELLVSPTTTPATPHRVSVTVLTVDVPAVHLRHRP